MHCRSTPCSVAALALLGLLAVDHQLGAGRSEGRRAASEAELAALVPEAAVELAGLWSRYEGMSEGEPVRFWYFHGDGHGLYRYGRVGYTNTHSFDYTLRGDRVSLRFRKTGEAHELVARIEAREGKRVLRLEGDPRDPGATYTWARPPISAGDEPGLTAEAADAAVPFAGHMWVDFRSFATGGAGFALYQFGPAAIDGRGVGWFHEGDFDEWRTEALSYRVDGERVELFFDLNAELGITPFQLGREGDTRVLELDEDPRDFWLRHRYRDAGRAFGTPAFDLQAELARIEGAP